MTKPASLLVLASLGLATGCATLFADKTAAIPVATNPPGAYVYVNGQIVGQTPTIINMEANRPGHVQIYLPGFRPVSMVRSKSFSGWFWANILVWPGFIIDFATGAYEKYSDEGIGIGLTPEDGPPPQWYQLPPQTYEPPPVYQQPPTPGPAPVQPGGVPPPPLNPQPPPPQR